jgi:PleD family two-component response regulator
MHGGTVEARAPARTRGDVPRAAAADDRASRSGRAGASIPRTERTWPLTRLGDLRGVRVLAVDDEEDALTLLRGVLETAGAEVTTVSSSRTALARIEEVQPNVLILDLGMPEMDGFELIRQIRSSPNPPSAICRRRR